MKVIDLNDVPRNTKKSKFDDLILKAVSEWDLGKAVEITEKANAATLAVRLRALIKMGQVENDVRFIRRQGRIFLVEKKTQGPSALRRTPRKVKEAPAFA
jgi:hypothetical protein